MPKSNISVFAILTTLALLTWVLVDAYLRLAPSAPKTIAPAVLSPLTPSLDTSVLDTIEGRTEFGQEGVAAFRGAAQASPAASPSAETEEE